MELPKSIDFKPPSPFLERPICTNLYLLTSAYLAQKNIAIFQEKCQVIQMPYLPEVFLAPSRPTRAAYSALALVQL